ncbi:unnamed protein product [Symbiodinium sp. CCMP2592]|nr:unnamed protein product [Symbiodinium sp. CCMP2592]
MSGQKKRPSLASQKAAASSSKKPKATTDAAGIGSHPLIEALNEAQACLAGELKDHGCNCQMQQTCLHHDLQGKEPLDFAGVSAYDKQDFAAAMKKYGSVKLKAEKKYKTNDGFWHAGDSVMEPITAKVQHLAEKTEETTRALKSFFMMARSYRVRYVLIPDDEQCERRKFELAEEVEDDKEVLTLQGFRQLRAVHMLQEFLRQRGKPCDAEAIEKWLGPKIKNLKAPKIKMMVRIYERMNHPEVESLIVALDDEFGSSHCFNHLFALDIISSKTWIPKNEPGSIALLKWCMEIICANIMQGRVSAKLTKEGMVQEVAIALLKKRVATFCINKFAGEDKGDVTYEPHRAPSQVLSAIFSSFSAVRSSGIMESSTASSSLGWLGLLPAYQIDVIMFLAKVLRGHASLDEIFDHCVTQDKIVPAETALVCEKMLKSGLFDLSGLLESKKESELKAPPDAPEPPKVEEKDSEKDEKPEEPDKETILAGGCEEAPKSEPPRVNRVSWFSKLHIPQVIISVLEKHSDLYFEQVIEWAEIRVRAFMNLEVKETAVPALKEQLARIKGGLSCLFIMDVKSRLRLPSDGILLRPFRRPVPLNQSSFRKVLHALWNDPAKQETPSIVSMCRL